MTRGLAALGVIWGHSIYSMGAPLALNGAFWVWVFLPLSGYLVARSFDPGGYARTLQGSWHFLWNRALRLVPLAEGALLIGLLIALVARADVSAKVYRQFLFVPPLNDMSLVGPLWTVAAELQFYLAAILLLPAMRLVWRYTGVVGGALAWVGVIHISRLWITAIGDNSSQPRTMIGNLAFFVFGILLAQPLMPPVRIPAWLKTLLIGVGVGVAWYLENYNAAYFWAWGPHTTWPFGGAALCALVITAFVLLTQTSVASPGPIARVGAALQWCGFYTYGIYVAHSVLVSANNGLWHVKPGWARLAILVCAVPIAPLTYSYFERWWLRMKVDRPARVRSTADPATVEAVHGG